MAKRTDANQAEIVRALRDVGASVLYLHELGKGAPDLAVGFRGLTFLVEIKDGAKPPSAQALTADEERFEETWRGHYCVVRNVEEALRVVGVLEH